MLIHFVLSSFYSFSVLTSFFNSYSLEIAVL